MASTDFLTWEARQQRKWEFDGFRPVAMNGGTAEHNTVQGNIVVCLRPRLRGSPCRLFGPDMCVPTGEGRYRYPDGVVTCSPLSPGALEIAEPVVIFEVLSEGTSKTDRTVKLMEYRSMPSVRRYVMLEQDQALLSVITRSEQGWTLDVLRAEDTLAMPEIGIEVPVAELYLDVDLPPPPPDTDV